MKLLLSTILISGILNSSAQVPSDRELAGLRGSVKSVEISAQETDRTGKPAYPVEKQDTHEYDRGGTLIKTTHHVSGGRSIYFTLDGKHVSRYEHIPGAKTITVQVPVGAPADISRSAGSKGDPRYEYRYDRKLDPSGRVTAIERYNSDGSLRETRAFTYDTAGRIATETLVEPKGPVLGDIYKYDAKGVVIQRASVFYLASGEREVIPFRYSNIKLDAHGNWVYRVVTQGEGKDAEIVSIETRKITYH